jgi:hypothetical protein
MPVVAAAYSATTVSYGRKFFATFTRWGPMF